VKRAELIRTLAAIAKRDGAELVLLRHGGRHDVFVIGRYRIEIPRHREIAERLARAIVRDCERNHEEW
jgi:hypothetical protein